MNPEDLDRKVAEILGVKTTRSSTDHDTFHIENSATIWYPSANLNQAVDFCVPWLNEKRIDVNTGFTCGGATWVGVYRPHGERIYSSSGQGNTPAKRMASALCKCVVKVAKDGV